MKRTEYMENDPKVDKLPLFFAFTY